MQHWVQLEQRAHCRTATDFFLFSKTSSVNFVAHKVRQVSRCRAAYPSGYASHLVAGFPAGQEKNCRVIRTAAPLCNLPARYRMRRAAPSGLTRLAQWTVRQGKTSTLKARALQLFLRLHRTFGTAKGGLRSSGLSSAVSPASWRWKAPTLPAYPADEVSVHQPLNTDCCRKTVGVLYAIGEIQKVVEGIKRQVRGYRFVERRHGISQAEYEKDLQKQREIDKLIDVARLLS